MSLRSIPHIEATVDNTYRVGSVASVVECGLEQAGDNSHIWMRAYHIQPEILISFKLIIF